MKKEYFKLIERISLPDPGGLRYYHAYVHTGTGGYYMLLGYLQDKKFISTVPKRLIEARRRNEN
jgi:hypothetical protein